MKKGITPVISLVLLLLIVVVIVGLAAGQLMGIFSTAAGGVEEGVGEVQERMKKMIKLDAVGCTSDGNLSVSVKNIGSVNISKGEVAVYLKGELISEGNFSSIPAGSVKQEVYNDTGCKDEDTVTVSGPGNDDSKEAE